MQKTLAGGVLALLAAPTLFLLYRALQFTDPARIRHLGDTILPAYAANTLALVGLATLLALLIGVAGAFLVVFFEFRGRRLLGTALVLPLVFPPYLVAIVYRELPHQTGWLPSVESLWGAVLVLAVTLYPYVYLLVRTAFQRQAMGFIEIGQSLGLERWQIASRALFPLAVPAIMLGALLVAVEVVSDFGTVDVLGVNTLTTLVHRIWFDMYEPGLAAQVAVLTTLLPLTLVLLYGWLVRGRGFANPANRQRPPQRGALAGAGAWLAPTLCSLPVLIGFAIPLAVLLDWAWVAFAHFPLARLVSDLGQTLILALGATVLALLLGVWLSLVARWAQHRAWTLGAVWVVSLNYAMPAVALGIALLFLSAWTQDLLASAWLSNSIVLVMAAVLIRFLGFAYFSAESGLQVVSRRVDESVLCAGRDRRFGVLRVLLPMIRGPVMAGGLLVFVMAAKELTLSLLLQPFDYRSLALSIYYFADIDVHEPAAIYALCLVLVVIYPVMSINRWLDSR